MTTSLAFDSLLITGGAGFVGASLALRFKEAFPGLAVHALDNLHRRGSELNLPRLRNGGVGFVHGDVRCPEDLESLPEFDVLVDCAAEPSVHAGAGGNPQYVVSNNLIGTCNCLEAARRRGAAFLLLSTSRVYPIPALNGLPFCEEATRFRWPPDGRSPGFSAEGIAESFPLDGPRSFYGASKLASEILVQEYVYAAGMKALIDRCGVLAGPWQMGKVDQGVVALWVARHVYQRPLEYIGFEGTGKQVRDILHVDDLFALLVRQMQSLSRWDGGVYNVGGGERFSISLVELTELCRAITGCRVPIAANPRTNPMDLRIYVTDAGKAQRDFQWCPTRPVEEVVRDVYAWIRAEGDSLAAILG
jgi:CDP-paratose 2-epimerase